MQRHAAVCERRRRRHRRQRRSPHRRLPPEQLGAAIWEGEEVVDGCAAETVERLIVVADDAEVLRAPREPEVELLLDGVGVLVLVDDDVLEDLVPDWTLRDATEGVGLDEREVSALGFRIAGQQRQVRRVHLEQGAHDGFARASRRGIDRLLAHPVEEGDGVDHGPVSRRTRATLEVARDLVVAAFVELARFEERGPVTSCVDELVLRELVQEDRSGGPSTLGQKAPVDQQAVADRVHRADRHPGDVVGDVGPRRRHGQQSAKALTQLVRSLFGERAEEDPLWLHIVKGDQVERSPDQNARLARAGTRGEVQRALEVADGAVLLPVGPESRLGPQRFKGQAHASSPGLCLPAWRAG